MLIRRFTHAFMASLLLLGAGTASAGSVTIPNTFTAHTPAVATQVNANSVFGLALQPDGKVVLGGTFTSLSPPSSATITRNSIARLNADGSADTAFDPNISGGGVTSVAVQPDGKLVIGGVFTSLSPNGGATFTRNNIARLNADGSLDTAFDPNISGVGVASVAIRPDGKLVVGENFTSLSPNGGTTFPRNNIARLNADGSVDTSFNPNATNATSDAAVAALALQSDGKIIAGGVFTQIGGQVLNPQFRRTKRLIA